MIPSLRLNFGKYLDKDCRHLDIQTKPIWLEKKSVNLKIEDVWKFSLNQTLDWNE